MGIPLLLPPLPETLRDIAAKLLNYGFQIRKEGYYWRVILPPGADMNIAEAANYGLNWGGSSGVCLPEEKQSGDPDDAGLLHSVGFDDASLPDGLLKLLRFYEEKRSILYRYEQVDLRWKDIVYGKQPGDTTIGAAGCGPTSLAIVLQYLMNNGSRVRNASYSVTPPETAKYAETHGRVSGHGTAGDPMIRGVKDQWPEFEGVKVTLAEAIQLLEEGRLIIFLCKGCSGKTGRGKDVHYGGHYMVLAGVDSSGGPNRRFYVVDPGRREKNAMKTITYTQLSHHVAGFWWVHLAGEVRASFAS